MANITSTQQASDGGQLTKPTEWAHFMVTAALKFASDEKTHVTYTSHDEARLDVLNTLNWYEAHSEYEWPNFMRLGFDFSQAMRFRRALVNDVFVSLQKAGNVRITSEPVVLGTPQSIVVKSSKRSITGGRRMAERKRHCKREDESDTDADSEEDTNSNVEAFWADDSFLAEVMRDLMVRSMADIDGHLGGRKDGEKLAAMVYDGLVEAWEEPQIRYANPSNALKKKQEVWARHNQLKASESSPELGAPRSETVRERTGSMSVLVGH